MKSKPTQLVSVSPAAMDLSTDLAPDVRTECESAVVPYLLTNDDAPPDVVSVPKGPFAWP